MNQNKNSTIYETKICWFTPSLNIVVVDLNQTLLIANKIRQSGFTSYLSIFNLQTKSQQESLRITLPVNNMGSLKTLKQKEQV